MGTATGIQVPGIGNETVWDGSSQPPLVFGVRVFCAMLSCSILARVATHVECGCGGVMWSPCQTSSTADKVYLEETGMAAEAWR